MPPVSNTHLTDLATVKKVLKIATLDVASDAELTRMIPVVSSTVKQLMNRKSFITDTYTEKYSGNGNNRIFLNAQPVTAVTSVYLNGVAVTQSVSIYHGGWSFDKYGLKGNNLSFPSSYIYDVTYTGGFALTSEEALMAEEAVCATINLWWKRRPHVDVSAVSMGNQVTHKYIQDEIPPEAMAIIRQLRRVA